jgi:hypothetical protein
VALQNLAAERQAHARQEAMESSRRRGAQMARRGDLVANLALLAQHYPHVEAGVLVGLAQRGVLPGSPEAEATSQAAAEMETDDGGGFFKDLGDLIPAPIRSVAKVPAQGLAGVGGAISDVARPVVRTAFTALETPIQEATGQIGELVSGGAEALQGALTVAGAAVGGVAGGIVGSVLPGAGTVVGAAGGATLGAGLGGFVGDLLGGGDGAEAHSTGLIALEDFLGGKGVDLGKGFFSGGRVRETQAERMRELGRATGLGDQGFTIGRYFANEVAEPGSNAYKALSGLTDFGVQIVGDPAAFAGGAYAKALEAKRVLRGVDFVASDSPEIRAAIDAIGGVEGARRSVLPEQVHPWLFSEKAAPIRRRLVEETDFGRLWAHTGRGKIDPRTVKALTEATDEIEVINALAPALGFKTRSTTAFGSTLQGGARGLVRKGFEGGFETTFGRPVYDVRLFGGFPEGTFDLRDDTQMVENIDRVLLNAKVPQAMRSQRQVEYLEALGPEGKYQVIRSIYSDDIAGQLAAAGYDRGAVNKATQLFFDAYAEERKFWVQQVAQGTEGGKAAIALLGLKETEPHLIGEFLSNVVELPDPREVRRALSPYRGILSNKDLGERMPLAFAQSIQSKVWKRLALLRPAYPVRVIGEEQGRMGAVGLDSLFSGHPISYISWVVGDSPGRLGSFMRKVGVKGKGAGDITGTVFDRDPEEAFAEIVAFKESMATLHFGEVDNPAKTIISRGTQLHGVDSPEFHLAWADEVAKLRLDPVAKRLAAEGDANLVKQAFWEGDLSTLRAQLAEKPKWAQLTESRAAADAYVDSVLVRLDEATLDDPTIRRAIATGFWDEEGKARLIASTKAGRPSIHRDFKGYLRSKADGGEVPPEHRFAGNRYFRNADEAKAWDRGTDYLFDMLMAKNTNSLSRSPSFRQFYYRRVEELAPLLRPEAQAAARANAAKFRIDLAIPEGKAGNLTLREVDEYAKGFALDETKALLYDLSEKGQFFDVMRLVFPFGEAWKEVIGRWAKIAQTQPKVVRRAQQAIEGARGAGFFYTNTNGEEVFAYPGTAFLTKGLLGTPIPLEGRVQGLSLMTEVLPGVGPVAQVPAAWFLPHNPSWDSTREILFPFGEPKLGDPTSFAPAWVRKLKVGFEQTRNGEDQAAFNKTVMHIASQMVSTGEVPIPDSPGEQRKLLESAASKANKFWVIRGLLASALPSQPSPQFLAKDKDGTVVAAGLLREQFQKAVERDGYTKATTDFLNEHGEQAFLNLQPLTNALVYGAPVTTVGRDWVRSNPGAKRALPNTYGLFAPVGGDFDYAAYLANFDEGARENLTPEQYLSLANNRLGRNVYERFKAKAGPNPAPATRERLRQLREFLAVRYPGYSPYFGDQVAGVGSKVAPEAALAELRTALNVKAVRETPQARGLAPFLRAWDAAAARARQIGLVDHTSGKAARPLRDALRQYAAQLGETHVGFAPIFDSVFDRLLSDDLEA